MIEASYLVICMTAGQKELLDGFENVQSMREICGFDIPDPYGCDLDTYRRTADLLRRAVDMIIEKYFLSAQTL